MESDFLSPRMPQIIEDQENETEDIADSATHFTFKRMPESLAKYDSKTILYCIRSFIDNFKASNASTNAPSSLSSLLLYIKQLNESVSDLLNYQTFTADNDCDQVLIYLNYFNEKIIAHLNKIETHREQKQQQESAKNTAPILPHQREDSNQIPLDKIEKVFEETTTPIATPRSASDTDRAGSNHTNVASEGKQNRTRSITPITPEQKRKRKEMERRVREEIKRRNIDENFNFYESYHVLKQETNYRLHSQQHYSGKLGLKNISRLQLLRLTSNIITRCAENGIILSHDTFVCILRGVFHSKLNGKKFQNVSCIRFEKILNLSNSIEKEWNVSFFLYNNIKQYFEKKIKKRMLDIEHYYQGRLYIDRKFIIMNEILYGAHEYEQMFKIEEKATEDEIYDAQNYGDIYRICKTNPSLLFKKIELECFDDLQSVLNEQYGLKIFDENCQLYFGTEVDYNDDGDEIEYISSRLIMTEYAGATLAEKIYDYAEENSYLTEYDIGGILYKVLLAVQHMYRKNVIHCDLKPDNMIININDKQDKQEKKNITINLIDFGYCEIVKGQDFIVQKHLIKGTKGYIAPEIFEQYKYSKKSDIYSIGCIGFEMITGGTLPSDYDIHCNYIQKDDEDEEDEDDADEDEDDDGKVLDVDIEAILKTENKKRAIDNRISWKLIKFISKLVTYDYEERYDIGNAVLVARKNWSNMKPLHKNRTAFF